MIQIELADRRLNDDQNQFIIIAFAPSVTSN